MLQKIVAPVVLAGVLLGGALSSGTAGAAAPPTTAAPVAASTPAVTPAVTPATADGQRARAWLRAHRRHLRREGAVVSAKAIGITTKDLVAELRTGKSVADVAGEHGVSTQTVVNALVSAADARVAKAVADHKLTAAQATRVEAKLPTWAAKAVNHVFK